jgi:hypothetical protein
MIQASQIREHMEVVGSDGGHVGKVDHVRATRSSFPRWTSARASSTT